jgi:hypothetical protein
LAENKGKNILPVMLERETNNGIDVKISNLSRFYAFKHRNIFDPWSEDLFQKLVNNILYHVRDKAPQASNYKNLELKYK